MNVLDHGPEGGCSRQLRCIENLNYAGERLGDYVNEAICEMGGHPSHHPLGADTVHPPVADQSGGGSEVCHGNGASRSARRVGHAVPRLR